MFVIGVFLSIRAYHETQKVKRICSLHKGLTIPIRDRIDMDTEQRVATIVAFQNFVPNPSPAPCAGANQDSGDSCSIQIRIYESLD